MEVSKERKDYLFTIGVTPASRGGRKDCSAGMLEY